MRFCMKLAFPIQVCTAISSSDCSNNVVFNLKSLFGHNSSTDCPISAKFCMSKQNDMSTRAKWQNLQIFKIQDGGRPPIWKSLNRHMSVKNRPILMKFCTYSKCCSHVVIRRFPDSHFPGQMFPGQDDYRTDDSRSRRFLGTIFAKTLSVFFFFSYACHLP